VFKGSPFTNCVSSAPGGDYLSRATLDCTGAPTVAAALMGLTSGRWIAVVWTLARNQRARGSAVATFRGKSRAAEGPDVGGRPGRRGIFRRSLCQFRLTYPVCQFILTDMDIENLSLNISSDDPAIGLRASLALHRLAERVEANQVASAREKGWSWQQIGDALGVTRQSVHTKYNKESS